MRKLPNVSQASELAHSQLGTGGRRQSSSRSRRARKESGDRTYIVHKPAFWELDLSGSNPGGLLRAGEGSEGVPFHPLDDGLVNPLPGHTAATAVPPLSAQRAGCCMPGPGERAGGWGGAFSGLLPATVGP
jgi:hypothetical protein